MLFVFLLIGSVMLHAQNVVNVKGTVLSKTDNLSIIGASVVETGTTNGVITDMDGNFTLTVPAGATITISYVGYKTVTVKAAPTLNIVMEEDNEMLDEVVITGYMAEKKASLTGSVSVVKMKEVADVPTGNVMSSLQGRVAGMNITNDVIRRSLATFKNIEHRLENVMSVGGVLYINDSKATNVNSTWYALECMDRPVVWIAGGTDKGNDYSEIADLVKAKVKALVCLGKDNRKLHESFSDILNTIEDASSAKEAVDKASRLAQDGDVVLLSPCCASFDLFKNYEDRGRQFKQAVREL